jgi:hypothetical protein
MSMKLINSNLIFSNKIVLVISKEMYFSRSLHTLMNVFLESKLRIQGPAGIMKNTLSEDYPFLRPLFVLWLSVYIS